ncbi:hypothetical protein U1Q18_017731 [Sarracenia purpurea var. burkii]
MPPPAASPSTWAVSTLVLDSFRPGLPGSFRSASLPLPLSGLARFLGFDHVSFCSYKQDYYLRVGSFSGGRFSLVWSSCALESALFFFSSAGPVTFGFLLSFRGASSLSGWV